MSECNKAVFKVLAIAGIAYALYVIFYPDKGKATMIVNSKDKPIEGIVVTNNK